MSESISIESASIVAARLKEARARAGLSTRAVADQIARLFPQSPLSHGTIANYEKAKGASPPVKNIAMLAEVYKRDVSWFLERSQPLVGVRYRYLQSRVLLRERHQFETEAQHCLEGYVKVERHLKNQLVADHRIDASWRSLPPDELAKVVREKFECGVLGPVRSVVEILEGFGVRVVELPSALRIDGLAARFGSEHVVVLNPCVAHDRQRLNAGHELGHILYDDCVDAAKTTKSMEDRAFEFACCLLIPPDALRSAFKARSAIDLVKAKETFGISMAAMVYRAEKLNIIDERTAKKLWIQFAKRGWRANEPGRVRPDRATRLESMIDHAVFDRRLTWSEAATLLGISRSDLEKRMKMATGCPPSPQDEPEGGEFTLKLHE